MAESKNGSGVQSVERALDILESLAQADGPMGLTTLIRETGLPLATVHRLLATLGGRGYVRQEPESRRYVIGPSVLKLREPYTRLFGVWAEQHLAELAELSQETANLAVLDGHHVVYIAQVAGPRRLRMFTHVGNRVLPHASAVGKVLLAFGPRAEAERVIDHTGLPQRTPATITSRDRFLAELDVVARQGYAVDAGEEEDAVRCLAVPVFLNGHHPDQNPSPDSPGTTHPGPDGDHPPATERPVAALSISGPAARLESHREEDIVAVMTRVAADLSASLHSPHSHR
ncbi:IclR family transcriptional regulator [Phytoactinopolyspora limicola]|uniref:IclR family transcriptional regulator n=1 Tax=Phytoactinopolyspora limicola TaxID=2715536 RepID=UPI001FEBF6ED|nr:IclR family transcriptional regulator [Phytoactinopolyspora limicola]